MKMYLLVSKYIFLCTKQNLRHSYLILLRKLTLFFNFIWLTVQIAFVICFVA